MIKRWFDNAWNDYKYWVNASDKKPFSNLNQLEKIFFSVIAIILIGFYKSDYATAIDFSPYFRKEKGTLVLFADKTSKYEIYNKELAQLRVSPCSTFKIVMTLAGLKYDVLQDEKTLLSWDHVKRELPCWNQDLELKMAFNYSAVWYFEEVYKRITHQKINDFVKQINYGNQDVSFIGRFWLNQSLKISPIEQVEFLKKLFSHKLPIAETDLAVLQKIMFTKEINGGKIYGKTGASGDNRIGWFVGFYEKDNSKIYFALRLSDGETVSGARAKEIIEKIFTDQIFNFSEN